MTNNEYYADDVTAPTECPDGGYCLKITIADSSEFRQIPFRPAVLADLPLVSGANGLRSLGSILTLDAGLDSQVIVKGSTFEDMKAPYDGCFATSLDVTEYI